MEELKQRHAKKLDRMKATLKAAEELAEKDMEEKNQAFKEVQEQ